MSSESIHSVTRYQLCFDALHGLTSLLRCAGSKTVRSEVTQQHVLHRVYSHQASTGAEAPHVCSCPGLQWQVGLVLWSLQES